MATWATWPHDAGCDIEESFVISKSVDYRDWVAHLDTPQENHERVGTLFADPPEGAAELCDISHDVDGVESFSNPKVLIRTTVDG